MNPSLNGGFSPNQATNPQSRVNDTPVSGVNSRCTLPLFQMLANTERFADLTPVKCYDVVGGESFSDQIRHQLRTYTYSSPLLSSLRKHYAAFFVPRSVISPVNYERMKMAPKVGDDIPFMDRSTNEGNSPVFPFDVLHSQLVVLSSMFSGYSSFDGESMTIGDSASFLFWLWLLYTVYSPGSLLSSLGYTVSRCYQDYNDVSQSKVPVFAGERCRNIDEFLDSIFKCFSSIEIATEHNSYNYIIYNSETDTVFYSVVRRMFSELPVIFSNMADSVDTISSISINAAKIGSGSSFYDPSQISARFNEIVSELIPCGLPLNIDKLIAYKLVYAQFFTNDNLDDICTSKKMLQMFKSDLSFVFSKWPTFEYNGDFIDYDVFSYKVLYSVASVVGSTIDLLTVSRIFRFYSNLFSYESSLVYEDYFLSSRQRPLAVEQTLNDPYPSETPQGALQTVRDIAVTRYLNAVNSLPNRLKDYVKDMYKYTPQELDPQPRYITDAVLNVFTDEIVNTSENQGNVETNLQSSGNFSYNVQASDDAVVLVLTWYDVPRIYVDVMSRMAFHYDRFDDFQPYLQNIGDQPLFLAERGLPASGSISENPFGYLGKDAEYKQLVSRASGAFSAGLLPSWVSLYRFDDDTTTISPDIIRNKNSYLDQFYKSLTGDTLSSYFHFICVYYSNMEASKPMNYVNNILMP